MARKTQENARRDAYSRPECKFSSKGVSKRLVKDPLKIFKGVLRTGKAAAGRNKGFRVRNNGIYTYEQTRCGFSYFYCKRRVLDDGIHTVPLDLVMCPVRKKPLNRVPTEAVVDDDAMSIIVADDAEDPGRVPDEEEVDDQTLVQILASMIDD